MSRKETYLRCNLGRVYEINLSALLWYFLVDIVYIGTIHPYHKSAALLCLNNNKPVLCEKPLTLNYRDSKELIDLAKQKQLFFMEVKKDKSILCIALIFLFLLTYKLSYQTLEVRKLTHNLGDGLDNAYDSLRLSHITRV